MFLPLRLGAARVPNRVACSPMAMYSAIDGVVNDFHLAHLGARALGGAGLIFSEMTCVSPEGRITPGCAGLYNDGQMEAYRRIVDFVHAHSESVFALQLGHSGAKGSTRRMWEGENEPLPSGNWPVMSASSVPWSEHNPETDAVAPVARVVAVVAARRPAVPGEDVPVAAAKHAVRARDSPLRIGHTPGGISPIPVLTPLKHVPDHVIQSPAVRGIAPYRRRLLEPNPAGVINVAHRRIVFAFAIKVRLSRLQTAP
jgi:hypothetical protein